ncbi:uncharacterized protein LOC141608498 [Silene latifolia]|uniref:uncharacterized protein LOC141608498 n=1 Tax=Silene latifolia TaxID=37657 RepID=UPI003D770977
MVLNCNLTEMKTVGAFFTWNNKHENGTKVYSKLDRVLINADWLTTVPECYANFLPEGLFDHCPCLIKLTADMPRKRPSFKYFNMWSLVEEFEEIVQNSWYKDIQGTPMYKVVTKLKMLKKGLRELNHNNFSDIENITKDPLNKGLCDAESACAKELMLLKKAREQYLLQKSKEKWMSEGDENTAYYHASIKQRRMRNKVYQIKDMNGKLCTKPEEIQAAFENYYKELLGTSKKVSPVHSHLVTKGKCLTAAHLAILNAPVTDEEVRQAMYSIPGTKAPGPDGYSSQFFKDSWAIVGVGVSAAVRSVIHSGKLLKECNTTTITLVPKIDAPENVTQFRPIACCNTIYKCVAKVLCNRLSTIMPDIISPSQSAFVTGRDIVGNILLTQDLVKMYKRKACSPRLLMKIDLQKAYDSVEWSFTQEMLMTLGFPNHVVGLLMQCVSTPTYSIALNGEVFGFFQGKRGLRQGDPLSPLLFTICLERDKKSVVLLLRAFKSFSNASGLCMNQNKSSMYSNGVDAQTMIIFGKGVEGMRRGTIPFKYLGVTITPKRLGVEDCHCLIERISTRIRGLGARKLSYAGRVVLIKSVLSTLHNYWARIFILPKTIINKIEAQCRQFLWHGNDSTTRPALVAWSQVCQTTKKRGLGLKQLYWWNLAAIAKYVWWIAAKTDHLWVRWIHSVYIKQQDWMDYKPGVGVSWAWKKICGVKEAMKPLLLLQGTGTYTIKLGYDWLVEEYPDRAWHPWITNHLIIPRHKFTVWLIAHNRLLTMDRLMKMNIAHENECYFCGDAAESIDHLFFQCDFSKRCLMLGKVPIDEADCSNGFGESDESHMDNARPHIKNSDPDFKAEANKDGWNIELSCQPPNSPDLNVLDLGFFRAIQSLQQRKNAYKLDKLVVEVNNAFEKLEVIKLNYVFITLQACMIEVLKRKGGNDYPLPHMHKSKLAVAGLLPDYLTADLNLVQECITYLNNVGDASSIKKLVDAVKAHYADINEPVGNITEHVESSNEPTDATADATADAELVGNITEPPGCSNEPTGSLYIDLTEDQHIMNINARSDWSIFCQKQNMFCS